MGSLLRRKTWERGEPRPSATPAARDADAPDIFRFEDKVVDLVSNRIDISVRAGQIKQQSYRGRKAGAVRFILVASPKYLERVGKEK